MAGPHVVVVGAGMGGLAAAMDLAAAGARVTLLERHDAPGGKMRRVSVAGRGIDTGPTVFTMRWIFDDLFRRAGRRLEEHVPLRRAEVLARHAWLDGSRLDLYADLERSLEAVAAFAGPSQADAYRRFVARSGRIFDLLDESFMRTRRPGLLQLGFALGLRGLSIKPFSTLWKELSRIFDDPRLVQLFARYATYCGSSPFRAPATLMLIAEAERRGVWLVEGGMHLMARALSEIVTAEGGSVRYGAHVHQLDVGEGRVRGVVLDDGERIGADAVVFNGDSEALARGLLGEGARRASPARGEHEFSLSAITWSLLAPVESFPLAHHTVFFGDDYPGEFAAILDRRSMHPRPTIYVCAQDRGDDGAPLGEHTAERLFLLVNAPPGRLSVEQVAHFEEIARAHLQSHGLALPLNAPHALRATPNEYGALFPASRGALYGRPTHGWTGSFRRPGSRTPIRGLYLAGGSVHPGAGIPMATQSGCLAASELRRDFGLAAPAG